MKNLYQLTASLSGTISSGFNFHQSSSAINDTINKYITTVMFTASGKKRYPSYYECALRQAAYAVKDTLSSINTLHGYWYKGELYTTHKNQSVFKTTNDLAEILPMQEFAKKCRHGIYYADNASLYFEGEQLVA